MQVSKNVNNDVSMNPPIARACLPSRLQQFNSQIVAFENRTPNFSHSFVYSRLIYSNVCPLVQWFRSYLRGRSQQVTINGALSKKFGLECGVPQGLCLGPLFFTIYASKLFSIVKYHIRMQTILNYSCHFVRQRVRVKLRRQMLWRNAALIFVYE